MWLRCVCGLSLRATMSSIICGRSGLTVLVSLMGSSFLSEVDDTSILRTGALHCYHYPLSSLPASRLLLPRSGLERSDFVPWHFSDLAGQASKVGLAGQNGPSALPAEVIFSAVPALAKAPKCGARHNNRTECGALHAPDLRKSHCVGLCWLHEKFLPKNSDAATRNHHCLAHVARRTARRQARHRSGRFGRGDQAPPAGAPVGRPR